MKKTIKTGVMIALFAVCIFLLLPFVITERTNEQKDEQLHTAQPQVYSSNPLTSFFQRAKDLLASKSDRSDKNAAAARKRDAKAKEIARGAKKLSAKGPESLAAQRPTSDDSHNASGSSFYTPKNYDFALYQSVGNGVASDGANPTAQTMTHNPLFLADVPEDTPVKNGVRNSAYVKDKMLASAKKSARSFPVGYSLGGVGATAGALGVNAARNASYGNSYSNTDTAKILQDIARMRADARYPNPQTEAERLAREEFMRKEHDRNLRHLNELFRRSIVDPENPHPTPVQPEDYADVDELASVIFNKCGQVNSIARGNACAGLAEESGGNEVQNGQAQNPADIEIPAMETPQENFDLEQALSDIHVNIRDLTPEQQAELNKNIPVMVVLGTTQPETYAQIVEELERLNPTAGKDNNEQEEGEETENSPENSDNQNTNQSPYKKTLETYKWLYRASQCDQEECVWIAAENRPSSKDLVQALSYANAQLKGDPLHKEAELFSNFMQEQTNSSKGKENSTPEETEDFDALFADSSENVINSTEEIRSMAQSFDAITPYIPYLKEDMKKLSENTQNENETASSYAQDQEENQQDSMVYFANIYQQQQNGQSAEQSGTLVDPTSFSQHDTSKKLGQAILKSRVNNTNYRQNQDQYLTEQMSKSVGQVIHTKLSDKNNKK